MNKMVIVLKRACSYVKEQSTKKTLQCMCKKHISGVQKTTETFLQQKRVATVSATGESAAISEVTSKTFSKAKKRRKEAVAERQEEKSDTEPEPEFRNVAQEESES